MVDYCSPRKADDLLIRVNKCRAVFTSNSCLILELFEEGNLKVKIDTGIVLGLHSEESAFFFFEQILKAVDFLHSRGIFHLDIKVKFNFNIKLF